MRKLFLFLLALAAFSCDRASVPRDGQVVIITTNDVHSAIDAFPSLATLVEGYRQGGYNGVVLVDAGDRWTGNPYVDIAREPGKPIIDLMNELGYQIATFGNHEFDNGIEQVAVRTAEAGFIPVLANADFSATELGAVEPYTVITVGGLRLLFLGLITTETNGHPPGHDASFGGAEFFDPVQTAAKYSHLRDSTDVFIALSHSGLDIDTLVARAVPSLDLVLGSHSHDALVEPVRIGNVLVTQGGSRLAYASVTTVTVEDGKVAGIDNRLVKLDTIPADPHYAALVQKVKDESSLKDVVGEAAADFSFTALINLFSDVVRLGAGAHFAFYNVGGLRIDSLPAGPITIGDLYSAEPFGNSPVVLKMTEAEIADFIMRKFNSSGKESHTVDIYPSGMTYTVVTDARGEATDVILRHDRGGSAGSLFLVAMSDYMDSQYDFPKRGTGEPTGCLVTGMVSDYLEANSPVRPNPTPRVVIRQGF